MPWWLKRNGQLRALVTVGRFFFFFLNARFKSGYAGEADEVCSCFGILEG